MSQPASPSDEDRGQRDLRKMLARHNWHVVFLTLATLFVAAAGWALVYAAIYWMLLVALTLARGAEAVAPSPFLSRFVSVGIIVCAVLWLTRSRGIIERPRGDKSPFEVFTDLLLVLPRTTVSAWDSFLAFQFLDAEHRSLAWRLLQRLQRDPALPAHSLPQELPDARKRQRVLMALQLIGLVEFQWRGGDLMLILRENDARKILEGKVRIRLRR